MTRKYQSEVFVGKCIPGFPQRRSDVEDSLQNRQDISACIEARMPYDTLILEEQAAFPDYLSSAKKSEYLYIRNSILKVWNQNPGQEVTLEAATKSITKIQYQNQELINAILIFLIRRGRINHGVFRESPQGRGPISVSTY